MGVSGCVHGYDEDAGGYVRSPRVVRFRHRYELFATSGWVGWLVGWVVGCFYMRHANVYLRQEEAGLAIFYFTRAILLK